MIELNNVRSNKKPLLIDEVSSPTTVYVRSNVRCLNINDPLYYEAKIEWRYDEIQYTKAEWEAKKREELEKENEKLLKQNADLQQQINLTQLSLAEVIAMVAQVSIIGPTQGGNTYE